MDKCCKDNLITRTAIEMAEEHRRNGTKCPSMAEIAANGDC